MESPMFGTRNQYGNTKEYDSLEEAMKDFLGYDGYRLDIMTGNGVNLHIYREDLPRVEDEYGNPNHLTYGGSIMVMKRELFENGDL